MALTIVDSGCLTLSSSVKGWELKNRTRAPAKIPKVVSTVAAPETTIGMALGMYPPRGSSTYRAWVSAASPPSVSHEVGL